MWDLTGNMWNIITYYTHIVMNKMKEIRIFSAPPAESKKNRFLNVQDFIDSISVWCTIEITK